MKLEDFNLTENQLQQINRYIELLTEYNQKFNLISKHTVDSILDRHVIDCMQITNYIDKNAELKIADFGSGAGLPGIIVAIVLSNASVFLIESNSKKTSFLNVVKNELGLKNVVIYNDRIENINKANGFDIVTARALASLDVLWKLTKPLLKPNGYTLFLKGRKHKEETELLLKRDKNIYIETLSAILEDSKIIKINKKGK